MNIGINASNIKSVGGVSHIYNLIAYLRKDYKKKFLVNKIIIWCSLEAYKDLKKLKNNDILIKKVKYDNLIYNLFWKLYYLNYLLRKNNCDIFFSLDGIVIGNFKKIVILYQNLIPFNYQEIINYGFSFQTLKNIFTFYLYKISTIYADGYIILNNYGSKLIESKLGVLKNKKIIPHGVGKEFFKVKKKDDTDGILEIIYISPIDHYKHQWNVVQAVKNLNDEGHIIKLRLVGPASNKQSFKNLTKQIEKANLNNKIVFYYGPQSKNSIVKLMSKCDLFLFASSCESFGLTLLEGMASDLAVITSNKSGLNFTSENKAIYFNPLNISSIKKSILRFIKSNKVIKKNNIDQTKKIAKKYNWQKTSNSTFEFLQKTYLYKKSLKKKFFFKTKESLIKKIKTVYFNNLFIYSYSINFFTPIATFFLFYLNGFKNIAVQYAIILSIVSFFTQIFSANARNLIIADRDKNVIKTIYFRSFLSFLIVVIGAFLVNIFYEIDLIVLISPFLLVSFTWIKEIAIAASENLKNKNFEFFYQLFYSITFFFCLTLFYLKNDYNYLLFFPIFVFVELALRVILLYKKSRFNLNSISFLRLDVKFQPNLAFWSGFYLTLLNIIIRILVDLNYTPNIAADYFFCFSVATFPGTIVTSILGASYLSKEKQFPIYFKFLILTYFLGFVISIFLPLNYFEFNTNLALSVICLTGIIAVISQSIRQLNIINLSKRIATFKRDIVLFFISIFLLLGFIKFFSEYFIVFILCSTILSLINYLIYYNPLNNHNL